MKIKSKIYGLHILFTLLFVAISANITIGSTPEWNVEFGKKVNWMQLTPTGHLIVSTDEGLAAVDPESGDIMWRDENLKKLKQEMFDLIPFTQFAVINKSKGILGSQNRMIVFDYVEGVEKWNSDKLDIISSLGQFIVPSQNALLVHGRNKKGKDWPRLVNLETGDLIWENPDFFKKRKPTMFKLRGAKVALMGNQEPLYDSDETMITCMNGKAIRKWNLKTGEMIWETELKELRKAAPAPNYGYTSILHDKDAGIIYVPAVKSLYAIKTSDGSKVWGDKPAKLNGMAYQLRFVDDGILVKGGPNSAGKDGKPFVMLLDKASGENKWKKPFTKLKGSTGFMVKENKAYMYSNKKVIVLNIADGSFEEFTDKIKFKGKETPSTMRLTEKGFLLKSTQNLMMIGHDGSMVYHTYHKPLGGSLLGKIATTAVITAINVGSAMDASARANAAAQRSASGRGSASYSLITSNPYLSKRFTATKSTADYSYILTKVETGDDKGSGIVKVNTLTGDTDGSIVLDDKKPVYEVDNIESKLFYVKDKKQILCFKF
ncbi:MAG: PQQ-like beta-propeller repeat protein [candidate division Zixibacteria bacterium]|nr:PQQ-like beta-propeller repeat protein [candidate division Zixibacteria bacterium]